MGQEIARNVNQIDFVFSGPALKSFPRFVRHCLDQKADECHTVPGVLSKTNGILKAPSATTGRGELKVLSATPSHGEELDIDELIDLNYDSFLESHDRTFEGTNIKPILLFETSRGCWWGEKSHCTFCGLNGATMTYRSMKPENALKQFDLLFKYSSRIERLESVDNILPKSYLRDVFPNLKTPPHVSIFYEVKADLLEEDMQVLSHARVKLVQPGIEALATPVLKIMKKGTSSFQNLVLLKNCVLYDIYPLWNLLVGFPGEPEEVYRKYDEDLPLLTHLPPPSGVYPVRFDRYSPYFNKAKEYGLSLSPVDYYEFIYPFSKESLTNLAYYFTDTNFGANYVKLVSRWISKLQSHIAQWQARWRQNQAIPPRLFFKGNGQSTVVYDSRSTNVIEHDVGEIGARVLECLNKPKRLGDVANELSHSSNFDPAKEIALLQSKGLVFNEGERYFSLVLSKETPGMTAPM